MIALVVIPYARVNLTAGPLWASRPRRTAVVVGTVTVLLVALFAAFACWPIVVPTVADRGGDLRGARRRERAAGCGGAWRA